MRIEPLDFLERPPGILENASIDRHRRAKDASVDAPAPHADLEALPLLGRSVSL